MKHQEFIYLNYLRELLPPETYNTLNEIENYHWGIVDEPSNWLITDYLENQDELNI